MSKSKNLRTIGILATSAVTLISLTLGTVATASEGNSARGESQSQRDQQFSVNQNFSNNREQVLENGMEPVIVQPTREGAGALAIPGKAALYVGKADTTAINYRQGSPVMTNGVKIHEIWYGWSTTQSDYKSFTDGFLSNFAGTPRWTMNTSYFQQALPVLTLAQLKYPVISSLNVTDSIQVAANPTRYKSPLSQSSILNIIKDTMLSTVDPDGIYVVLTAPTVSVTGFGTSFCGWHSYNAATNLKYSFVGIPSASNTGCAAQAVGPNSLLGADSMLSVLVHEIEETATDPKLNAWYSANGNENSDKCAWTWGTLLSAANAPAYNLTLGGKNYLIQQGFKLGGTFTGPVKNVITAPGACANA